MVDFFIMGEDELCCELAAAIILQSNILAKISTRICAGGFGPFKARIAALSKIAQRMPVFMVADGDQDTCVVRQRDAWMPKQHDPNLMLRLAVREAESWILADHEGFSAFAELSPALLPPLPDLIPNPKEALLHILTKSKRRVLRDEMLPDKRARAKTGLGYNMHLATFVQFHWSAERACERSPSLARSISRVKMVD